MYRRVCDPSAIRLRRPPTSDRADGCVARKFAFQLVPRIRSALCSTRLVTACCERAALWLSKFARRIPRGVQGSTCQWNRLDALSSCSLWKDRGRSVSTAALGVTCSLQSQMLSACSRRRDSPEDMQSQAFPPPTVFSAPPNFSSIFGLRCPVLPIDASRYYLGVSFLVPAYSTSVARARLPKLEWPSDERLVADDARL